MPCPHILNPWTNSNKIDGVFQYLNEDDIQMRMRRIHEGAVEVLRDFERLYRQELVNNGIPDPGPLQIDQQWTNFMNQFLASIVKKARDWMRRRLIELIELWASAYHELLNQATANPGPSTTPAWITQYRTRAETFHELLTALEDDSVDYINFPEDFFKLP